ncbi:unnamed protein product, partial [Mesorhabditis belari]|uniref:Protein VAC14 homolog n=1 Tax=Mesorhabditis belari TaxID=2138241 RepID=A0AAF3ED75_9BILA
MSDAQYAPLSLTLVKTLTDKLYDKRKAAALDVEKIVRDLYASNQLSQVEKVLSVLRELVLANVGNTRKGGLIGMAAAAIALAKNAGNYSSQLIEPVLDCFNDPDLQVRYYACESLYNIIKMCKAACLDHFEQIFDVLWKLSADTEQNVRGAAELLDRQVMDIVCSKNDFDVAMLMCLIRGRIYVQVSSNRRFLVQWLNILLNTPTFSCLPFLSEVIDGLFKMLGDPQGAVRESTETVMEEFLLGIKKKPEAISENDLSTVINVVCVHAHIDEPPLSRKVALIWMNELSKLYGSRLVPQLSVCLKAILPVLYSEASIARQVNESLLGIISPDAEMDMGDVVQNLLQFLGHQQRETRLASLNWIRHLHEKQPNKLFTHMETIFPQLLSSLSDSSDEVLLLDLHLLSDLCSHKDGNVSEILGIDAETRKELTGLSQLLIKFALSLINMFRKDSQLLSERGVLIIRQLCLLIEPADIYRCLCVLLLNEDGVSFVQSVVSILHSVLMTSTELFLMRDRLRKMEDQPTAHLFSTIYRCWAVRPVCLLGLCLLTQQYAHAAELVHFLSQIDVTVDVLVEVDKLVNLIESPILAFVRMDLLRAQHREPLCDVLSALLMLLPQTEAFHTLHKRIQAIPPFSTFKSEPSPPAKPFLDLDSLKTIFCDSLQKQQREVRERHRKVLLNSVLNDRIK